MKTIRNWADLKEYGIDCLTGEACTLGARALCDLTPSGADLVREFWGILPGVPHGAIFQDNWNSGSAHSCFLPWDTLPSLAAFLMIKAGCTCALYVKRDGIYGIEDSDDQALVAEWIKGQEVERYYKTLPCPANGLSAIHALSGRSQ